MDTMTTQYCEYWKIVLKKHGSDKHIDISPDEEFKFDLDEINEFYQNVSK